MDMEAFILQVEDIIKGNGKITLCMVMVSFMNKNNSCCLFMKDNGFKIIFMEKERLLIINVRIMKEPLIIKISIKLNNIGAHTMVRLI